MSLNECRITKQITACGFMKLVEIYIQHSYKFTTKIDLF